jgi:hypothetical protein
MRMKLAMTVFMGPGIADCANTRHAELVSAPMNTDPRKLVMTVVMGPGSSPE